MDYSLLQSLPLFQSMDTDRIRRIILLSGCFEKDYKKGNYIYFEQELIENMGLILKGHVYMTKENVWGEKTILVRMGKGELFGENFACSHSSTASVTFYAPEPATVLFIPYRRLLSCAGEKEVLPFIENLISMMTDKAQKLMQKSSIISQKTLRDKISCFLSAEAEKQGSLSFTIPYSREDLADYLCANRSALSRELAAMEKDGLIRVHWRDFELLRK